MHTHTHDMYTYTHALPHSPPLSLSMFEISQSMPHPIHLSTVRPILSDHTKSPHRTEALYLPELKSTLLATTER